MSEFKIGDLVTPIGHFNVLLVNEVFDYHLQCLYYNQKSGALESVEINKKAAIMHRANKDGDDQKETKPKPKKATTGKNVRKNGY